MTFSICVRETYTPGENEARRGSGNRTKSGGDDGDDGSDVQTRFGVAVTTRLPGVGTTCPFASENGAVATQSLTNVELGRKGIEYLDDGLAVEDALPALLNADEGAENRQLHGVDADGTFVFSGEECKPWYGHVEGDNFTVAGNLLAGEAVVDAVADTYEALAADGPDAEADAPLAERLIDALAAGQAEGGDKREDLHVQSAAVLVESTEDREMEPYHDDLRVDATETPIEDLRATYELAREGYEMAVERYVEVDGNDADEEDADEADESTEATE